MSGTIPSLGRLAPPCLGRWYLNCFQSQAVGKIVLMTPLQQAWADLPPRLRILEPEPFSSDDWALVERMHANFNDRRAHTYLPLPIARFSAAARKAIHQHAKQFDEVRTENVNDRWLA